MWTLTIAIVVGINCLGWLWCYSQQSDKGTDLCYTLSFLLVSLVLWWQLGNSLSHHLLSLAVGLWALRLGIYLFVRVHKVGKDERFDERRSSLQRITLFWSLQTISILILLLPVVIAFSKTGMTWQPLQSIGLGIWALGLGIESLADAQKFKFRNDADNNGQFVNIGLWKWVQHPNYLGEILCWWGIFLMVMPYLMGWEWLAIISPLWITFLLSKVSGIPILQKTQAAKYGHLSTYQSYKTNTAKLIPFVW